jgi:hypothetical protein
VWPGRNCEGQACNYNKLQDLQQYSLLSRALDLISGKLIFLKNTFFTNENMGPKITSCISCSTPFRMMRELAKFGNSRTASGAKTPEDLNLVMSELKLRPPKNLQPLRNMEKLRASDSTARRRRDSPDRFLGNVFRTRRCSAGCYRRYARIRGCRGLRAGSEP